MLVKVGEIWVEPNLVVGLHARPLNGQLVATIELSTGASLNQLLLKGEDIDSLADIINKSAQHQSFGAPENA